MVGPLKPGRRTWLLWTIVVIALAVRLYLVLSSVYLWDEDREWIELASSISLEPGNLKLPVYGYTHPVLPAYFMRAGTVILGENPLGFRFLNVVAGVLTVILGYRLASQLGGQAAGAATALLLALNEYHVVVSAIAIEEVYYLLFALMAMAAFGRFLQEPAPAAFLLTGVFTGLSYLCNERAVVLVPVWGASLLLTSNGRWLLRWPTWAALLAFLAVISPDMIGNWVEGSQHTQASYEDHASRFAGLGLTYQPLAFFGKNLVSLLLATVGIHFRDWAPEYPAMNELFGAVLFLGVLILLFSKDERRNPVIRSWLVIFCAIFIFFLLLETEYNRGAGLDPQVWYWVDLSLLPGALLAGVAIGRLVDWRRWILSLLLIGGCLLSSYHVAADRLGLPRVKGGASPAVLWPSDGRAVEVRAGFLFCVLCDQKPEIALEDIAVHSGGRSREPYPGEVQELEQGEGRRLLLLASSDTWFYSLHYGIREKSGRETPVTMYVLVRDSPPSDRPMFWLADAVAEESAPR